MRIYLAGPFFNKAARYEIELLINFLESHNHEVWAPMRDGIFCPKDADRYMRRKVYEFDVGKILWSECVVALLDYPLPIYQRMALLEKSAEGTTKEISIQFPDVGTVYEIGYAVAKEIPCIGCAVQKSGFNLMLAEALAGIANTHQEIQRILELLKKKDFEGLELLKIVKQKQLQEF